MATKKRVLVYVDADLENWLKEEQVRTGASRGEIIRRALRLTAFATQPRIEKRIQPILIPGVRNA